MDALPIGIFASLIRVLRCNQLFPGGIDYPVIKKEIKNPKFKKIDVKYWLVPKSKRRYYLIKSFKG